MKKINLWMLSILFVVFFVTSCSKEEDPIPAVNESEVLATYLESNSSPAGKDFVNTDMPALITATEVKTLNETGQVYIIDVRTAADFAIGHIENAHNVAIADVITHIKSVNLSSYTKVAIVCYSGQSASFTASVLRLLGYSKVFAMKWGMCSWHVDFAGKWQTTVANGNAYASQFTSTATEKGAMGSFPVLSTGKTTGQEILEARAVAVLSEGWALASLTNKTVFDNLSTYYVVNYWPADIYADPGHIPGAMQYTPKASIKLAADLKTLPTNKPVVVYCYTGHTSAFLVAYLRLLGYDAKSLLFGANSMIYDLMVAKNLTTYNDAQIMGYDYVH